MDIRVYSYVAKSACIAIYIGPYIVAKACIAWASLRYSQLPNRAAITANESAQWRVTRSKYPYI